MALAQYRSDRDKIQRIALYRTYPERVCVNLVGLYAHVRTQGSSTRLRRPYRLKITAELYRKCPGTTYLYVRVRITRGDYLLFAHSPLLSPGPLKTCMKCGKASIIRTRSSLELPSSTTITSQTLVKLPRVAFAGRSPIACCEYEG